MSGLMGGNQSPQLGGLTQTSYQGQNALGGQNPGMSSAVDIYGMPYTGPSGSSGWSGLSSATGGPSGGMGMAQYAQLAQMGAGLFNGAGGGGGGMGGVPPPQMRGGGGGVQAPQSMMGNPFARPTPAPQMQRAPMQAPQGGGGNNQLGQTIGTIAQLAGMAALLFA